MVIRYLGLKSKTPKQVNLDMEASLERMPFDQQGKKVGWQIQTWQGEHERPHNARFYQLFNFQGLEGYRNR